MLSDIVKAENIILNLESEFKDDLFHEMVEVAVRQDRTINREEVICALEEREEKLNTCVKTGVAVPHANCDSVRNTVLIVGISASGIDYETARVGDQSYEKSRVHVVLMLLFEKGNAGHHLKVLSDCARVLQAPEFVHSVLSAKTAEEVCYAIRNLEVDF